MKQIPKIYLQHARNAEHFLFHHNVLAIFTAELAALLKVEAYHATYAALFEREDAAVQPNTAFEQTQEMVALDKTRDDLFLYVRNTVDANLTCPEAARQEAALRLSFVIRPYRWASSRAYMESTTLVINMVSDLLQPDNAPFLEALHLTGAVLRLKAANEKFNETFIQRSDVRVTRASGDKVKQIRPQVDKAFRDAAHVINALYTVSLCVTRDDAQTALLAQLIDGISAQALELRRAVARHGNG